MFQVFDVDFFLLSQAGDAGVLFDPSALNCHVCVYTRLVCSSAANTPADDTGLIPAEVRLLVHKWAARVTLATVFACSAGAEHCVVDLTIIMALGIALRVGQCWDYHLTQLLTY